MKIRNLAVTLLDVTRLIAFAGLLTLMAGSALAVRPDSEPLYCADLDSASDCYVDDEYFVSVPMLKALCDATDDAADALFHSTPQSFPIKDRDREGLVSKVLGAGIKLSQGKTEDAEDKLSEYEVKLDQLDNALKPKITDDDADALSAALYNAQLCVAGLTTPTPTPTPTTTPTPTP